MEFGRKKSKVALKRDNQEDNVKTILGIVIPALLLLPIQVDLGSAQAPKGPPLEAWNAAVSFTVQQLRQHQPDLQLIFESESGIAIDMPEVVREVAVHHGGTVAAGEKHLHCGLEKLPPGPKEVRVCRMSPGKVLLRLRLNSVSETSAVVEVGMTTARPGGKADIGGHELLLRQSGETWSVDAVLRSWAS